MCNKVKWDQCFAVTHLKKVAIFQASLNLVREEAGGQISNKDNKCLTFNGSKHLHEGRPCKKIIHLDMIRWFEVLWWWWGSKWLKKQNHKYHSYAKPVQLLINKAKNQLILGQKWQCVVYTNLSFLSNIAGKPLLETLESPLPLSERLRKRTFVCATHPWATKALSAGMADP